MNTARSFVAAVIPIALLACAPAFGAAPAVKNIVLMHGAFADGSSWAKERFFAKGMKATTTELNASHVSMLSQPKAVAAVIMDAAEKAAAPATAAAH